MAYDEGLAQHVREILDDDPGSAKNNISPLIRVRYGIPVFIFCFSLRPSAISALIFFCDTGKQRSPVSIHNFIVKPDILDSVSGGICL